MNNIESLIAQSGKKLTQISKETGLAYPTLSGYNQGIRTPKRENANILAEYFGVSVAYLLGYTDDPKTENIAKTMVQATRKSTISSMTPYRSEIQRFSKEITKKDFMGTREQLQTIITYGLEDYSPEFQRLFSIFLEHYSKQHLLKEFVQFLNNAHQSNDPNVKEMRNSTDQNCKKVLDIEKSSSE